MSHLPALLLVLATMVLGTLATGCEGCVPMPNDGGPDGGEGGIGDGDGDGDGDGGLDGGSMGFDAGPSCDENTDGVGDPCAAREGDPLCGTQFCCSEGNPLCEEGQQIFCFDLGPNDCGGCGELDTAEGRIGETCGEFDCGQVSCSQDGTATECIGDHPRNVCDGCGEIFGEALPGEICSTCNTGVQTCTRDQDSLACWRGREPDNDCGGCGRCILFHAFMDERLGGGYIRTGTTAMVESIGPSVVQLVFDPLIEGPGTNGLPRAQLIFNSEPALDIGAPVALSPFFAEALTMTPADPVRTYLVPFGLDLNSYTYVFIYDYFLNEVISAGVIVAGPPPGYIDPPLPDGGVPYVDAGPLDGGLLDGGLLDGGLLDGGVVDAGPGPDGGLAPDSGVVDAGTVDGGVVDAGPTDGG